MLSELQTNEILHELQIAEESMIAYKHQLMRNKGNNIDRFKIVVESKNNQLFLQNFSFVQLAMTPGMHSFVHSQTPVHF